MPGRRRGIVAIEPLLHVEDVVLLRPEQAGQRPPLHVPFVGRGIGRRDLGVKQVRLHLPGGEHAVDEGRQFRAAAEPG